MTSSPLQLLPAGLFVGLLLAGCLYAGGPSTLDDRHPASLLRLMEPGEGAVSAARTLVDEVRSEVVLIAGPFHIPSVEEGYGHPPNDGGHGGSHEAPGPPRASGHEHEERSPLLPLEWPV